MRVDPNLIVAAARECLGFPFRHMGRDMHGMDCAGLAEYIAKRLELSYIIQPNYPRSPYDGTLERGLDEQPCLSRIDVSEASCGDLLLMRIVKAPQHIAIHAGQAHGMDCIIHAYNQVGRVCEHILDDGWRRKIVRAYRFVRE